VKGRLLAGLALLGAGLGMIVTGVFSARWLLLAGLVPLPVAGWMLRQGLERTGPAGREERES
jgi:hypothetical protein